MSVKVVDEILVTLKNRWFLFVYSVKTKTRKIFWLFALNCLHHGQHFINGKFSRNLKTSWRKSPVKVGKKNHRMANRRLQSLITQKLKLAELSALLHSIQHESDNISSRQLFDLKRELDGENRL